MFYCTSHVHYILSLSCRNLCIAIGLGQVLSLLICGTAVTSGLLQQQSVIIPTGNKFNICKLTFLIVITIGSTAYVDWYEFAWIYLDVDHWRFIVCSTGSVFSIFNFPVADLHSNILDACPPSPIIFIFILFLGEFRRIIDLGRRPPFRVGALPLGNHGSAAAFANLLCIFCSFTGLSHKEPNTITQTKVVLKTRPFRRLLSEFGGHLYSDC